MKKIFQYILMTVAMVAMASCSQDEVLTPSAEVQDIRIVVSEFPAFDDAQTRAIGTFDSGKTAWAPGDVIYIVAANAGVEDQILTLTYGADGQWADDGTTIHYLSASDTHIRAIYAPNCETEGTEITAKDNLPYGTGEFLEKDCYVENGTLTVDFTDYKRPYSRLRIAATANEEVTVTTTGFTPAGPEGATVSESYTLTADDKGNAYLYGTFAANGTANAETSNDVTKNYIFESETESGKSYVLDASLGYFYDEQTNTYTVWSAKGLSAWGSAARANLSTNLILTNDITLPTVADGESNWESVGTGSQKYTGTIDGNYHTISGLQMNYPSNNWISFAGYADTQSTIKNLTFADAHISGQMYVGVVAGISKGTITNCHVISGTVIDSNNIVGGIVGEANGCTITGCSNAASVNGISILGGIAGQIKSGVLAVCSNMGIINSTGSKVGGVVGDLMGNTIVACWTIDTDEKTMNGTVTTGKNGVGQENVTPNNCYSGNATTINGMVNNMNTALGTTYGYQWQADTNGGYPTLVKITE